MLRRRGTPAGGLALLCAVLVLPAQAATPAPDPPPLAVAPEAPQPEPAPVAKTSAVRHDPVTTTVVTPAPVVTRTVEVPVVVTRAAPAKPAAAVRPSKKPKRTANTTSPRVKPKPAAVTRVPHDRRRVPLAAFISSVDEPNRGLLAFAGIVFAFVALGGAVVFFAARRELGELA